MFSFTIEQLNGWIGQFLWPFVRIPVSYTHLKVETEQKKILQIAHRLAESGQIVLGNSGDDAYV